jgi:uncharacterized protein
MTVLQSVAAGVVVCLAGMGQSAVGFGYALFATPLLLWLGIPLPNVITLVATCSMLQSMMGARSLKGSVPWRLALTATAVRLVGVVIGLLLLKRLVTLDTARIRAVIGSVLCLLVVIQIAWRARPVEQMHWGWAGLSFTGSGLLAGACGMGGPPLVLWLMAHNWSTRKTRGFLFAVFATSIPVQIVLLALTFGPSILWSVALGIAFFPLVYLGTAVGLPLGNRMGTHRLRTIAYAILLVIGVSAVVPVASALVR